MPTSTPSRLNSSGEIAGPIQSASPPNSSLEGWGAAQGWAFMTRKRVLVADDLAPVLATVGTLLRPTFEVVDMVSDGRAALEATLKLQPDLVVLDISMP